MVCKSRRCYTRLDDPSKMLCARCEAKHADRIDGIKKKGAAAGGAVLTLGSIALGAAKKLTKK